MPAGLKRRFVGLAAVIGVLVLINFPSPSVAAFIIGLLILGVFLTLPEGERGASQSQKVQLGREKVAAALQKYREEAMGRSVDADLEHREECVSPRQSGGTVELSAAAGSKEAVQSGTGRLQHHAADSLIDSRPATDSRGAQTSSKQLDANGGPKHVEGSLASAAEHTGPARASVINKEKQSLNGEKPMSASMNGISKSVPDKPNGTANGPPLAGGAAVLARLRWKPPSLL